MENNIQLKNNQIINRDLKNMNNIDIKELYDLYKNEFIISCESILIENQNEFLDNFYHKMNLIIKNKYGDNIFEKNASLYSSKKQCENDFVTDIYWPMHNLCSSALKQYSEKLNKSKNILINFRPHCIYDQVPLHTCGSKFIQIFDDKDENNKKNVLYVVCTSCNKCYYSNCIRMNCHYCQIDFYSEIINCQNNIFPATWKEYHCINDNNLTNEQMHCINCNKLLFIKNNKLFCKKCRELFDPKTIIWTCIICNQDFKSDIKIYNPLEFKEIEIAKRDAILYKKIAKPNYLPCNCISKYDIDNYNFVHEKNGQCKGLLYYSFINNKEFLVCSLCNKIYELIKFQWNCPLCFKKFITNELRFYDYRITNNNKNHNTVFQRVNKNYSGTKINNSNSQKLINVNINENYKKYNKNNSYIKKRVNSSFTSKNNTMNNSFERKEESSENASYKNRKKRELSIILNNDNKGNNLSNIANNNSNKDNNSITNKYNVGSSTAHSSHLNNNNIKQPQAARKLTDPYFTQKNTLNSQNKVNITKFINEKIMNIPFSTISRKNNIMNSNKKLYINNSKPYKTIEEYINNYNYNEKNNNNNLNTSFKKESNKSEENDYIKIKRSFNKYQRINKDNSFCDINNKSFISQKTDIKINQVYVPKKHIHKASAPTTPLYRRQERNYYYYNLNMNESQEKNNNYINYENNNKNNHSYEKRNAKYINISNLNDNNLNDNNLNDNIQKLRELSGPKIYPIIKKNIYLGVNNNNDNKNYNKIPMIQHKTNITNIYVDKTKMLNNHRNYTNMNQNLILNNRLYSNSNSNNNSYFIEKEKIKVLKNNRNSNLEKKNNKKNIFTNRNIIFETNKNKIITTNQKYYSTILNSSIDGTNNNQNSFLNKNTISTNSQNNNIKKGYKKDNNINSNDIIISKYKKLNNKEIQSNKKSKKNFNNQNRNTKKVGIIEYTGSNYKSGTLNKSINSNSSNVNNTNKKKLNKNVKFGKNEFSKNKEKDKEKETEKNNKFDEKEILSKDKNENNEEEEDELKVFNFDAYKIITQLGQGSFGKIYLVQNSNNELFTMKKLVYSEELDVQTVLKEYKMCYKLKHPNIVKILGIYSNKLDKTTYVVYVLMEVGLTDWEKEIKNHIEKKLFYKESELMQIMKQIINVLSFLQKQNISHRDIKPQNILVFKNNIYKVADFGEAKQIENMTINLACNSLRGTELYMSPLLFNGLRTGQVDIRHNVFKSDVYSLGLCILFAGSLEMMSLYDIRKFVEMDDVKNYLEKMFKDKYSQKFIDLMSCLLEIHENKRPDFIDLEKIMNEW